MKKILMILILIQLPLYSISLKNIFHYCTLNLFNKPQSQKMRVMVIDINEQSDLKQVALNVYNCAKDNQVIALLLLIDSYGGSAGGFSVIHDIINKVKEIKPVVSLIGQGAVSGGYLIASAANYIIAHSFSDIGSIGVISQISRYKNLKIKDKMEADATIEVFKSGKFKALTNPYADVLTEAEKLYFNQSSNVLYKEFLQIICKNRSLRLEDSNKWAEGKVFIAHEALELKLIDEIGTIFDAERKIYELLSRRNSTLNQSQIDFEFVFPDFKPVVDKGNLINCSFKKLLI